MKNEVILVGTSCLNENTGNYDGCYYHFALAGGHKSDTVASFKMAVAITLFRGYFDTVRTCLDELEQYTAEIGDLLEGRSENFKFRNKLFSAYRLELDEGREDAVPASDLEIGSTLYVMCDNDKPVKVASSYREGDYPSGDYPSMVWFFKKSYPQTMTLYNYLPFVLEGNMGYMLLLDEAPCGGPFIYAEQLAGANFFVVEPAEHEQDRNSYIVDFEGYKLTPDHTSMRGGDSGSNGYIIFTAGGKWGFIHATSGMVSPVEYDDIDPVDMDEYVRVKKNGEWGYLTEDFTFISEKDMEEDPDLSDLRYWKGEDR